MNNNSNMILLLLSIIIIILCGVSYLEFKKIKIELDKHKEILSIYKEKIELLLNLNKKLTQERGYNQENTYHENYVDNQELNNRHIVELDEIVEVADVEEVVEEVVEEEVVEEVVVEEVVVDDEVVEEVVEEVVDVVDDVEEVVDVVDDVDDVEDVADVDEVDVDVVDVDVVDVDVVDVDVVDVDVDDVSVDLSNIDLDIDNILNDISINTSEEYEVLSNKKQELFNIYIDKSVKELREILMEKNLPLSGNKTKQVHRILDNL